MRYVSLSGVFDVPVKKNKQQQTCWMKETNCFFASFVITVYSFNRKRKVYYSVTSMPFKIKLMYHIFLSLHAKKKGKLC